MICDECKQQAENAKSFTWMVFPRTQAWQEEKRDNFWSPEYNVYKVSFGRIEPLTISLCSGCFAQAKKWMNVGLIMLLTVLLALSGGLLYRVIVDLSHWRSTRLGDFALGLVFLILILGLAVGLSVALVSSRKKRETDRDVEEILKGRMTRELNRRCEELYRSQYIKQEWFYMPYPAFELLMAGKHEPLSEADYKFFMKASKRTGKDLNAARFGTPVATRRS